MDNQNITLNGVSLVAEPYVVKKGPKPGASYLRADLSKVPFADRVRAFGEDRITQLLQKFINARLANIMDEATDETTQETDLNKWHSLASNLLSAATGESKAQLLERLEELDTEMNDFIDAFNPANPDDLAKLKQFAQQKRELSEAIEAKTRARKSKEESAPTVA